MTRALSRVAVAAAALALAGAGNAARLVPEPGVGGGISLELETSAPQALGVLAPDAGGVALARAVETAAPREPEAQPEEPAPDDELASIDESWLDEDDLVADPAERDHTPGWNRRVFAFNEGFVRWVLRPISRGYQAVTPRFLREMIHNGFDNLESPVILANDLMQLDACHAGRTLGRFALNTTLGLAGFFDVATELGIERHDTDFGETLGRYGVRSGSYFILPILGPSTARDTFGEIIDTALRPEIWLLGGFPRLAVTGSDGLSTYDIQAERLDALRETSVDFYAALRSAYLMDRDAKIETLREGGRCGLGRVSE